MHLAHTWRRPSSCEMVCSNLCFSLVLLAKYCCDTVSSHSGGTDPPQIIDRQIAAVQKVEENKANCTLRDGKGHHEVSQSPIWGQIGQKLSDFL